MFVESPHHVDGNRVEPSCLDFLEDVEIQTVHRHPVRVYFATENLHSLAMNLERVLVPGYLYRVSYEATLIDATTTHDVLVQFLLRYMKTMFLELRWACIATSRERRSDARYGAQPHHDAMQLHHCNV